MGVEVVENEMGWSQGWTSVKPLSPLLWQKLSRKD